MIILSIIFICMFTRMKVAQASETKDEKCVMSIQIEKGDTLWGIAKENITSHYKNIQTYIDEIKECNSLTSDTIHEGQYLIVPYYCSAIN